jgi:hypothetical protein
MNRDKRESTTAHTVRESVTKKRGAVKTRSGLRKGRPTRLRQLTAEADDRGVAGQLLRPLEDRHETGPGVSGGDIDADWQRGQSWERKQRAAAWRHRIRT